MSLISPAFLFNLSTECRHCDQKWAKRGVELDKKYRIPSFRAELEDGPHFADLRIGWSPQGLLISLLTVGKKQSPWCRESRLEDSDGLNLWIDTRNTKTIHRASRFCHRFVMLPQGAGQLLDEPVALLTAIHRAKEHPKPVAAEIVRIHSEKRVDGYSLSAFIPGSAITGWDTDEHFKLGFSYAITDRELGWQTFSLGPEYPFGSDPSLWGTLELQS